MMTTERRLCLLSLDGGGIRGLSSIMILKEIMRGINRGRQPNSCLQPWQVFDLIGGTSTGGLIAAMLGRLRMSIDECEDAYQKMSERIFKPKRASYNAIAKAADLLRANERFNSTALQEAVKETIVSSGCPEDELLLEAEPHCHTFVTAVLTSNSCAALLRSYDNPESRQVLQDSCKIWEACRATSAATTFFDPITIGPNGQKFADGAFECNNPVQMVFREASELWPDRIRNSIVLSIGTGCAPGPSLKGNIKKFINAIQKLVTEADKTANRFYLDHRRMAECEKLFRFSCSQGLADIGLQEYKEKYKIADATHAYLSEGRTKDQLARCIAICRQTVNMTPKRQAALNRCLFLAVYAESLPDINRALADGANPNATMLVSLTDGNMNINGVSGDVVSALQLAITQAKRKRNQIVARLIESGANIGYENPKAETAFDYAIEKSYTDVVDMLLREGADIDVTDEHGFTALHRAAKKGDVEMIRYLLKKGADTELLNHEGYTALDIATVRDHEESEDILLDV